MELQVKKLPDEDGFRDMVRVPHKFRKDTNGKHISRGQVCRISANGKSGYIVVRGYDYKKGEPHDPVIFVDSTWRGKLSLKKEEEEGLKCDIKLEPVGTLAEWLWLWRANDPIIRIPAQISLISFFLGLLALALAIPPSVDWVKAHFGTQRSASAIASPSPQRDCIGSVVGAH